MLVTLHTLDDSRALHDTNAMEGPREIVSTG